jgi:hypothetical protein
MAGPPTFRYPYRKIDAYDDYMQIRAVNYVPPGLNEVTNSNFSLPSSSGKYNNVESNFTVYLPMPQGIGDENSVRWGDSSLDPLSAYALSSAKGAIESGNPAGSLFESGKSGITGMINSFQNGNGQDLVSTFAASKAVQALGANVDFDSLLSRASGQALNPNMELLFQGVTLRRFQFQFDLAPRDYNEAGIVKDIIRNFKQSSAAKNSSGGSGGGLFISAPNVYLLEFRQGPNKHPFLPSFKPCALLTMTVDYTGTGSYATYDDATPVLMKLGLVFQELNPIYASDYDSGDGTNGVGY